MDKTTQEKIREILEELIGKEEKVECSEYCECFDCTYASIKNQTIRDIKKKFDQALTQITEIIEEEKMKIEVDEEKLVRILVETWGFGDKVRAQALATRINEFVKIREALNGD